MQPRFRRLSFRLAPSREGRLVAELWQRGTLGVEIRQLTAESLRLVAYFEEPPPAALSGVEDAAWESWGAELLEVSCLADRDWLEGYRRQAAPQPVGRRLLVDPREPGGEPPADPSGRHLLLIPARTAFGTGSHESTRLVVEILDGMSLEGRRVLDLGTGSGILAFASLLFGARSVTGLEVELQAALVAGVNRRLNRIEPLLVAGTLSALRCKPIFDLALVNIIPRAILSSLPALARRLAPGAEAVFSGILAADEGWVVGELRRLGFRWRSTRRAGKWLACRTELVGP